MRMFPLSGSVTLAAETVDFDHPLPPGQKRFWPESPTHIGHVQVGHLIIGHLSPVHVDGHLEGTHLLDGHFEAGFAMVFESPRYVFGRFGPRAAHV